MMVDVPAGVEEDFVTGHSCTQAPRRETNRYLVNWLTLHGGESSGRGGLAAGEQKGLSRGKRSSPFASCETAGMRANFPGPQSPHLRNGYNHAPLLQFQDCYQTE